MKPNQNKNAAKMPTLGFKKVNPLAALPKYANPGDAGLDVSSVEDLTIGTGQWALVDTGLSAEIPDGYEIQVRSRSGMAAKHGVAVLNSPGTIDSSYKGNIKVILINHGPNPYNVAIGDRVAQLVFSKLQLVEVIEVVEVSSSTRGENGFGSTGA